MRTAILYLIFVSMTMALLFAIAILLVDFFHLY
jgi:hypothetical protein